MIRSGHGYSSSKKLCVPQPPRRRAPPKPTSSTPTSSTVVSGVGRSSSRKRRSLRLRERSETASTSRIDERRYRPRQSPARHAATRTRGTCRGSDPGHVLPMKGPGPTLRDVRVRRWFEDVVTPRGPYRLSLMVRSGRWTAPLPTGDRTRLAACRTGGSSSTPRTSAGLELARFMLALDDDTAEFHARFARDPLLGPVRAGARRLPAAPARHRGARDAARRRRAADRVAARTRDRAVDPSAARLAGRNPRGARRAFAARPAPARACAAPGLDARPGRGGVDLERLRDLPGDAAAARLARERGIGPWSIGVVALEGLGRYDHGLVGDLALVKLAASLWGRWPETWETAALLEPYAGWQGLAGEMLLLGWSRGLVPGADARRRPAHPHAHARGSLAA